MTYPWCVDIVVPCQHRCITLNVCSFLIILMSPWCSIHICDNVLINAFELWVISVFNDEITILYKLVLMLMYLVLQCFTVLMGPEVKRCAIWAGAPFHTTSLNDPSPSLPLFSQRWSTNACVSLSFQDALFCCELAMRREVTNWASRAEKDTAEYKSLHCSKREWYPSISSVLIDNLEALNIQTPAPGSHGNFGSWHTHAQNMIHTGWHGTSKLALRSCLNYIGQIRPN